LCELGELLEECLSFVADIIVKKIKLWWLFFRETWNILVVIFKTDLTMVTFHGLQIMWRVTEIIDRVVEAGIYNYWIPLWMHLRKLFSLKITTFHLLDWYYRFNLYHMQPVFYLLSICWCINVLCFMFEVLYNRVLNKSTSTWKFCVGRYLNFTYGGSYTTLLHPQLPNEFTCQLPATEQAMLMRCRNGNLGISFLDLSSFQKLSK